MTVCPAGSLLVHISVLIPWPRWPASTWWWLTGIYDKGVNSHSWCTCWFQINITDRGYSQVPYILHIQDIMAFFCQKLLSNNTVRSAIFVEKISLSLLRDRPCIKLMMTAYLCHIHWPQKYAANGERKSHCHKSKQNPQCLLHHLICFNCLMKKTNNTCQFVQNNPAQSRLNIFQVYVATGKTVHNQKHFNSSVLGHRVGLHNNVGHVSHLRQFVVISRELLNF